MDILTSLRSQGNLKGGSDAIGTSSSNTPPTDGSAVSDTDVPCPKCSYNLRGLSVPRCPECGSRFEWDDLLTLAAGYNSGLFEYRFYQSPVSAYLKTWRGSLRPRRFWESIDPSWPVRTAGLLTYVGFVVGLTWLVTVIGEIVTSIGMRLVFLIHTPSISWQAMGGDLLDMITTRLWAGELTLGGWLALPAYGVALGPLLVLLLAPRPFAEIRLQRKHVLRVAAYASSIILLWALCYEMLFVIGNVVRQMGMLGVIPTWPATICYVLRRAVVVAGLLYWLWSFSRGLKTGLKLNRRHSWIATIASLAIVALITQSLWVLDASRGRRRDGATATMIYRLPALMWPEIPR